MKRNLLISLASVVFVWIIWIVAYFCVGNDYILPSFTDTFVAMGKLLARADFWAAFVGTLLRTLISFAVSLVFGVALAILARIFSPVRAFLAPIISILRTVPTMALILLLILWTTPFVAPAIVGFLVLFPAVYAAALSALDEVSEQYGYLARVYRVGVKRRIFKMYLPLCAPPLLKQTGAILSLGIKITVSGEVLSSTYRSLGGMMQNAKMFVDMPTLLALTVVTVLLGFLLEGMFYFIYKLVVRWRDEN